MSSGHQVTAGELLALAPVIALGQAAAPPSPSLRWAAVPRPLAQAECREASIPSSEDALLGYWTYTQVAES
jgi:hypothetical protein